MKIRTLKTRALSMCLVVAIVATYSMVALAGNEKIAGEIIVSGKDVTVNGEIAKSGRTIFTASTIKTSKNSSAIVNVSKVGKVKVAPNSTLKVSFDKDGIKGSLLEGKVTTLNALETVNIQTRDGEIASLGIGESVATTPQDDDDDDDGGAAWIPWFLVFAGAGVALIIAGTTDNNRVDVGGGATTVSPNQ